MYTNLKSCIKYRQTYSDWVDILQGTPQGSRSSPLLYLLYINNLLQQLEDSGLGICIYNQSIFRPSVADDMLLISLSKNALQKMISICHEYSLKWRYEYNVEKCAVVTFNAKHKTQTTTSNSFRLGDQTIPCATQYKHLGIVLDNYCSMTPAINDAILKLRGTFFCILNSGIHPGGFNPTTLLKLYKSIVIPKALYGCELWNSVQAASLQQLERAHRLCIRCIQGLPLQASSIIAASCLGVHSIEKEIDLRKLQFFGRMCSLSTDQLS